MIWNCQWCGHPQVVPEVNPVFYVCDECGREAGGVFDPALPVRELPKEESELVDVRVTWSGVVPDKATLLALRSFDPMLRDESLAAVVDALRLQGYFSLGVHPRFLARRVAEDPRLRGLNLTMEKAG